MPSITLVQYVHLVPECFAPEKISSFIEVFNLIAKETGNYFLAAMKRDFLRKDLVFFN